MTPALAVAELHVTYPDGSRALRGVDLEVGRGRCLALVGESGSGKSTLLAAVLGLLPRGAQWRGSAAVDGVDMLAAGEADRRRRRGQAVGYVPQDPFTALDPDTAALVLDALRRSSPTLLLVTHDLTVAARAGDEVAVLYAGRVVEHGPVTAVLAAPRHPYTAALVAATPRHAGVLPEPLTGEPPDPRAELDGCLFRFRCGYAGERCADEVPVRGSGNGTPSAVTVACHYPR